MSTVKPFPGVGTPKPQNERRAWQAYDAIRQFTDFGDQPRAELETYTGDMLANIMHMCDLYAVDFEDALERGRRHYTEEVFEANHETT